MSALDQLLLSLAGAPSLPGARCRGKHHLFDGGTLGENAVVLHARWDQALGLCQRCPSLNRCVEWVDTLPKRQRPDGVVGGQIHYVNGRRPPADTSEEVGLGLGAISNPSKPREAG